METGCFVLPIVVAVFSTMVPLVFSADHQFEMCSTPVRCSYGQLILPYPFWGVNKPKYCGKAEAYQLTCKNNQSLAIDLKDLSFRVLSFHLENQTITVADESLFVGNCPELSLNFSGSDHYTLSPTNKNISLFSCPVSHMVNSSSSLTCRRTNNSMVTYHTFRSLGSAKSCLEVAQVPVLDFVMEDLHHSKLTLKEALKKGFDLSYEDHKSCNHCLNSGGICGSELGSESFRCLCSDKTHLSSCQYNGEFTSVAPHALVKIIIGVLGGGVVIVSMIMALVIVKVKKCFREDQKYLEALVPLKRYSYSKVKKITKSFSNEVGKGGFGIVYKGNLCDGRKVAVKVLKNSKGNAEDFINEVASMSKTSHVNIVTLLGFCYEGSKRAIIYEFLENGSLDKFINSSDMDWNALFGIALGVARGLEYLHNGCRERIVHFDIKPQNVLLDDNLCPKVSDFGLAKLCGNEENILSLLDTRGTIGYIAPEVFSRMYGRVSHKSDVYSYGMLVLEMIGARNRTCTEASASNTSSMYFPEWIYKDLEKGDNGRLVEHGITCEEEEIAKKLTLVGLWCIQTSPSVRPSMNRVAEMMEGSVDALTVPPRPVLQCLTMPRTESSWISQESSISSHT